MMLLAFLINLTAYPASGGLLPYVAQRVYHVDATGLGLAGRHFSFGACSPRSRRCVTGGPATRSARRSCTPRSGTGPAGLRSRATWARACSSCCRGFAQNVAMISMTGDTADRRGAGFRARVMGVRTLAVYGLPIGLIVAGVLIDRIGYPLTNTLSALLGLVVTGWIGFTWRDALWYRSRARV